METEGYTVSRELGLPGPVKNWPLKDLFKPAILGMGAVPWARMRALVEIPLGLPDAAAGNAIDLIRGFNFLWRCAGSDFSFDLAESRDREGREVDGTD